MNRISARASVLVATIATAGCQFPFAPIACTTEARPAVRVTVVDSLDGAALGPNTRVIAADGAFADTSIAFQAGPGYPPNSTHGLAHERPGTYAVTVELAGYRLWRKDGVRVRDERCHVRTVELTARLQKSP